MLALLRYRCHHCFHRFRLVRGRRGGSLTESYFQAASATPVAATAVNNTADPVHLRLNIKETPNACGDTVEA